MKTMTISALARTGGVGVETIRFYQRKGLLRIPKTADTGSYTKAIRRYDEEDIRRLHFIRSAQLAGFTLDEISELMTLSKNKDHKRAREMANQRITVLDQKIKHLKTARKKLQLLAQDCNTRNKGPCPIIDAFISN